MLDVDAPVFRSFLDRAVAKLPSKRGNIVVVLHAGMLARDDSREPEFVHFGLMQDRMSEWGLPSPPPARLAGICPVSV